MPATLNFFDTYILMAIMEEVVPDTFFFRDRYFPTGEGDVFAADKVLTEYRKGDRKMAAFVSERIGTSPWAASAMRSANCSLPTSACLGC